MSKMLQFKDNKYTFVELLKYASDERMAEYYSGEVTDLTNGELFDIKELRYKFNEHNYELLERLEHMSSYQRQRIMKYATQGYDEVRRAELERLFDNNTITYEECKELLILQNYKNRDMLKIRYDEFFLVNKFKPKPKGLTDDYYGKFFRMILFFMSARNRIEHIKNGKPIKKSDIAEHLELSNVRSLDIIIKKLCDFKLIAKGKLGNNNYIIINPAYVNMQFQITHEVYSLFKDDLDELLSPVEIRLLELSATDTNSPLIKIEE